MQKGRSIGGYWPLALLVLSLLLSLAMLSPVLSSGFTGDDVLVSAKYSRSALQLAGSDVVATYSRFLKTATLDGLKGGRLFPLSALSGVPLTLADGEPVGFKVYVVVLVLANIMLFGYLVYRVTGSRMVTLITLAILPITFQLRGELYDPILGFSGLLPAFTAIVLASLILLVLYLDTGKRRYAVLSVLTYAAALLTYEIAIALCLLHLIVVWLYPARQPFIRSVRRTGPYLALAASSASAALVLRLLNGVPVLGTSSNYLTHVSLGADPSEGAYALSLSPGPVLATLAKQIVAAVPTSYQLLNEVARARLAAGTDLIVPALRLFIALGLMAVIGVLVWRAWSGRHRMGAQVGRPVGWVLAAALVVLPNVLIALSPRYQTEVTWGLGHLPVYISYFGVALLFAVAVDALLRRLGRRDAGPLVYAGVAAVLAVSIGYCGAATYADNCVEVGHLNLGTLYPRALITTAAERGVFDAVSRKATFSVTEVHPWDTSEFFSVLLGRPINYVPSADVLDAEAGADANVSGGRYWIYYGAYGRGNGFVILGRQVEIDEADRLVKLTDVRLYLSAEQSPELGESDRFALVDTSLARLNLDPATFAVTESGADWSLYDMTTDEEFGFYF